MKKFYTVLILVMMVVSGFSVDAQTIWTGPSTTFIKSGGADWTLEANQDRITDNVWITRANNQGIFNIKTESSFDQPGTSNGISPQDTEWAIGTTANLSNLTFDTWVNSFDWDNGGGPLDLLNVDMVLHLITDDVYIDIKFLSWGSAGQGAPFSYERSTNNLSANNFQALPALNLYPNPSTDVVSISGLNGTAKFKLYNILGKVVKTGTITNNKELDIRNLSNGAYFFKLDNGATLKFIKR